MITRTNLNYVTETGRLGNQMWAIASAIGIAKRNFTDYSFLEWAYQPWFKNKLPNTYDINYYLRSNKFRLYTETSPYYQEVNLDNNYAWDLRGYFQSYKYFEDCKDLIKYYFTFGFETNDYSKEFVAIHVRRGDYLLLPDVHPNLTKEYYKKAMDLFPNDKFLVFSDDVPWVMDCDWFDHDRCVFKVFEEDVTHLPAPYDLLHMAYMSKCKSFIIANSSYSWWAAYLSDSPNKVIVAPSVWVLNEDRNDRIPDNWIWL